MALDIVRGESRNRSAAEGLVGQLRAVVDEGTVYLGYPVLTTADDRVEVDALLVSQAHGLVAFLLPNGAPEMAAEWDEAIEAQDRLYTVLEGYLRRHEGLRNGRRLALEPVTATVLPVAVRGLPDGIDGVYIEMAQVPEFVRGLPAMSEPVERAAQAAVQRVATIKPAKKRVAVEQSASRGAKLKEIEREIANLDKWQNAAAVESPEGPQRIRGLAGSGKTVVLALKAAYWHTHHPTWRIALTFHTRALYQQFDDLVTRFTFEHTNDRPDPEYLRIIHSWGSSSRAGVYSIIAAALGEPPRDWAYANGTYGRDGAFQGICRELLTIAQGRAVTPIFDAVLIDEAQDLPPEFFQLVYLFTKEPKRIVWAYDELQKLSESTMPDTDELFGRGMSGESLVSLANSVDSPRRDIVLPVCYRNSPWALATAHALGVGVYRQGGLLQHPDQPKLWEEIGYNVVHGTLAEGEPVTLERSRTSTPEYFPRLLTAEDAVMIQVFPDEKAQDVWVADQVAANLKADELQEDDILIVLPDTYRAKSRGPRLVRELQRRGISAHLAGVNTSVDHVFKPGSVAIAHIYRAKGNEASMVYAIDSQLAAREFNAVTRRNTLFTAITRSRAWVRITGWGDGMDTIKSEVDAVVGNSFKLKFTVPTDEELRILRHKHRERPATGEATVEKTKEALSEFFEAVDRGEVDYFDLPPALRTRLASQPHREVVGDDE